MRLKGLYYMLGCSELHHATWLASDLILERKLPIPFDKESQHIQRLAKTVLSGGGNGYQACLWVFEQLPLQANEWVILDHF
jgi:hypothetical protein